MHLIKQKYKKKIKIIFIIKHIRKTRNFEKENRKQIINKCIKIEKNEDRQNKN
jgi:hypothetical protein